jgi:alkylhydroperoxidase family enzyme
MDARVELYEYENLEDEGTRGIYDRMMERTGGSVPDFYKAIAGSPVALQLVDQAAGTISANGFDRQLRELVTITVAQETRTVLTWTKHYRNGASVGVPQRLLDIVGTPDIEAEPAPTGAVLRYARLVARAAPVDDDLVDELKRELGERGFIDLTTQIAFAGFICRVVDALRVPLDEEPQPFVVAP